MTALVGEPSPAHFQQILASVEPVDSIIPNTSSPIHASQEAPNGEICPDENPKVVKPPTVEQVVANPPGPITTPVLQSDISIDLAKLQQSAITPATQQFNQELQDIEARGQKWYNVGAEVYRKLRKEGLTPLPGAVMIPTATNISIPSRDPNRTIPCRFLTPTDANCGPPLRGIFMHIHGGGWVLNDEASSDKYLQTVADSCRVTCLSVGYRLAPEDPYPAAPDDCEDVALWLVANGAQTFGTNLAYIGGESAGASLSVVVALRLLKDPQPRLAGLKLKGLLLHYGSFSLRWNPSLIQFRRDPTLVLDEKSMHHFREAYCPGMTPEQLQSPDVSPFFADLNDVDLPPALFTVGTQDGLLEDSVFLSIRWEIAGHKAILKLYPGSPHGFIHFQPEDHDNTRVALLDLQAFIETNDC